MNTNRAEYHLPVNADVPPIEVILVAAIGNAIFHATGKRVRELPFTFDTVLDGQVA